MWKLLLVILLIAANPLLAQQPQLMLPLGHTALINYAEFSTDGKYLVTASSDGTAKMWRVMDGKLLKDLVRHNAEVQLAKFSPDGKFILTASGDNLVKIWEINSGKLVHTLPGKTKAADIGNGGIEVFAEFSPDGRFIATTSDAEYDGGQTRVWETTSGKMVHVFITARMFGYYPAFSEDSRSILININDSVAKKWEVISGKFRGLQKSLLNNSVSPSYSSDGQFVLEITQNQKRWSDPDTIRVKESKTGKTVSMLENFFSRASATFSPDARYVLVNDFNVFGLWETTTGKLFHLFEGQVSEVENSTFSRDGLYVINYTNLAADSIENVWQILTGRRVDKFSGSVYSVASYNERSAGYDTIITVRNDTAFRKVKKQGALAQAFAEIAEISPDGKFVVTAEGTWEDRANIWDPFTGRKLRTLRTGTDAGFIHGIRISPDAKTILTVSTDDTVRVWQANTGKILHKLAGHISSAQSGEFSPDGKYIVTTAGDNSVKIWYAKTGKLIVTCLGLLHKNYFSHIPSGYYQCSPDAAKLLHYVSKDLKVISFEQLDVKYNRPDKVLEAIGNTDTALIKSYRKAWEKRIKKLGIDTTAFRDGYSVPEADFANRDKIEYEQKSRTLQLHIRGSDSTYKPDRFNIWVNETPVFGQRGISIRARNSNHFDTTILIYLSQGENRIETSITNVNGTESYRMPLTVNYTPAERQKEITRFIGIGIDQFTDNKYNLQYSAKDIRDLSAKLKEKYKNDIIIDTLFNENVTVSNVKALKQKLQQTTENDKVIIAYSGHGMLSKEFDYYLSTYSINFDKPEQNGLPYEELENLLDSIPARKKLMLIDACHSGEVDKEDLMAINTASDSLKLKKGLDPVGYKEEGHLGLKNSFELMQSLFVNVGKSTGATIISAAAGTQFALERNDLKNGVFTFSILEAMNTYPSMKISDLKKIVGARVEELTNGLQKPTSRNETIAVDWNIW